MFHSIFFAVGHAAQKAGTQIMDEIRGLMKVNPAVGWGLMLGVLAIAVLWMGVYPAPFTDAMQTSVSDLLQHVAVSKIAQ